MSIVTAMNECTHWGPSPSVFEQFHGRVAFVRRRKWRDSSSGTHLANGSLTICLPRSQASFHDDMALKRRQRWGSEEGNKEEETMKRSGPSFSPSLFYDLVLEPTTYLYMHLSSAPGGYWRRAVFDRWAWPRH